MYNAIQLLTLKMVTVSSNAPKDTSSWRQAANADPANPTVNNVNPFKHAANAHKHSTIIKGIAINLVQKATTITLRQDHVKNAHQLAKPVLVPKITNA